MKNSRQEPTRPMGALLGAWLRLQHGTFWGIAHTHSFNKTGFDLIDCQISSFQVIDGLGVSYKITLR